MVIGHEGGCRVALDRHRGDTMSHPVEEAAGACHLPRLPDDADAGKEIGETIERRVDEQPLGAMLEPGTAADAGEVGTGADEDMLEPPVDDTELIDRPQEPVDVGRRIEWGDTERPHRIRAESEAGRHLPARQAIPGDRFDPRWHDVDRRFQNPRQPAGLGHAGRRRDDAVGLSQAPGLEPGPGEKADDGHDRRTGSNPTGSGSNRHLPTSPGDDRSGADLADEPGQRQGRGEPRPRSARKRVDHKPGPGEAAGTAAGSGGDGDLHVVPGGAAGLGGELDLSAGTDGIEPTHQMEDRSAAGMGHGTSRGGLVARAAAMSASSRAATWSSCRSVPSKSSP